MGTCSWKVTLPFSWQQLFVEVTRQSWVTDQGQLRLRGGHWTLGAPWKLGGPLCLSACPLLPLLLPHSSPRDGHQSASPVEAWRLGEGLTSTHKSHVHRHNLRTLRKQSCGACCVQLGFHHSAQWPRDPPRLQWHQQPVAFTAERCPWCGCDTACLPFTSEGHGFFFQLGAIKNTWHRILRECWCSFLQVSAQGCSCLGKYVQFLKGLPTLFLQGTTPPYSPTSNIREKSFFTSSLASKVVTVSHFSCSDRSAVIFTSVTLCFNLRTVTLNIFPGIYLPCDVLFGNVSSCPLPIF